MAAQNSAKRGKPFAKGKSGNPGGRPAVAKAFKDRMREWMDRDTDGGAARLIAMAEDPEHRDQFAALQLIAAYAYGKPTQAVEVDGQVALRIVVDDGGD